MPENRGTQEAVLQTKAFISALDMIPHLVRCVKERKTITYGELGKLVKVPPLFIGEPLRIMRDQILAPHRLPRIDALVVNKETGEANDTFFAAGREGASDEDYAALLNAEREKVYAYERWDEVLGNLQRHYGGDAYYLKKNPNQPAS